MRFVEGYRQRWSLRIVVRRFVAVLSERYRDWSSFGFGSSSRRRHRLVIPIGMAEIAGVDIYGRKRKGGQRRSESMQSRQTSRILRF